MKIFRKNIIDNVIVFMLIMSTGGLLFIFNRNLMYAIFIGILIFTVTFSSKIKKTAFRNIIFCMLFLYFLFWINYLFGIPEQSVNKYLYYMVVILVSGLTLFHFLNNRTKHDFINSLYFVLKIFIIHAFFQSTLYLFFSDKLTDIQLKDYECTTFYYLFFYASTEVKKFSEISFFGLDLMRNQGLFWEAGVAQLFFNIFFFLEAFIIKRSKLLLSLSVLVILSTYSTIGIVLLLIQLLYYILLENRSKRGIIFSVLLLFSISSFVSYNIQEKTIGEKSASFQKRYFDLIQPFYIALKNPLTGVGLDLYIFQEYRSNFYLQSNQSAFIEENLGLDLKMETTEEGSSNSFMYLLAAMGFPTALMLIYFFLKNGLIDKREHLFIIILSLSLFSSPLLLRPFFVLLILAGFYRFCNRFSY